MNAFTVLISSKGQLECVIMLIVVNIMLFNSNRNTRPERCIDSKRNTASNQFKLSYESSLEMGDEGVE
eukprot:scaffold2420_cov208-Alexandrium_tamarense.AAC.4